MLSLLQRTTANLRAKSSPTSWSPEDDLSRGFSSTSKSFALPLSSLSEFVFRAQGLYSQGTVVIRRAGAATVGTEAPSYAEASGEAGKDRQVGTVEIAVEARANSDGLYAESKIEPVEAHERAGLSISTPNSSSVGRIGAVLSFHITVTFPSDFTSLNSLTVDCTTFRLLFDPSLSSLLISNLKLSTSDAPIVFSSVRAQAVTVLNQNRINSNKTELKCFDDLVSGSLQAERLEIDCADGKISGSYDCSGALIVGTTNANIHGEFSGSAVRVTASNGEVVGKFKAKKDVVITNTYAKINVEVEAPLGCSITGVNTPIDGKFKVGKELKLSTTHFRIDAFVRLLPPPPSAPAVDRAPSPTPSSTTSLLPTFDEAIGSSSSSSSVPVLVRAETSGASIELEMVEQPEGVVVQSFARSSGGGTVRVTHPDTFEGSFSASTSLTHTALLSTPSTFPTASRKRLVHYDVEKRSEVAGTVRWDSTVEGGGRSRSVVEAEGLAEIRLM
ncbi:hypothetical protein JCM8547_006053 [Rhodosporidiobolus lusitaniae]